jgi:outer membrane lipoprotein-sorting protein
MRKFLSVLAGMIWVALSVSPAQALSQQQIIAKAEQALLEMKTLQADFIQFASDGSVGEGRIYFRRPHQLRIDYLNPETLSFVTSRIWIHVDDKIDRQVTSYPISQSPFYTLLQKDISFTSEELTTNATLKDGVASISMVRETGEAAGELILEFDAQNWQLRRWIIIDALGVRTQVTLQNTLYDLALENRLFGVPSYPVASDN